MNERYRQALGRVLAEKREAEGLSKQQLALMIGVNRLTVRLIERGEENPTVGMLLRITQGLGVSLADVLVETERSLVGEERTRPPIPEPIHFDIAEPAVIYYITRF